MEQFIGELNEGFEQGNASEVERKLLAYIEEQVATCYSLGSDVSLVDANHPQFGVSAEADTLLFPVFDKFLDKGHQLREVLQNFSSTSSSSVCGKVFGNNEIVYGCRDCGTDVTCVMCGNCFDHSEHKHHRYRISKSAGGGFCDCGDEEAWKSDTHCELHQPREGSISEQKLPQELEDRVKFIFRILMTYAYKVLVRESPPEITECSKPEENELYCTVLYNDESHTFDYVIACLQDAVLCSSNEGTQFATLIDGEGRCVVKVGRVEECLQARTDIAGFRSNIGGAKPLTVTMMKAKDYCCQVFALKVLEWMEEILGKGLAFRIIFADIVTHSPVANEASILKRVLIYDTQLWKAARTSWHHLWITGFLKDYHLKKQFATIFAHNYHILLRNYMDDDHGREISIMAMSVQIFTVPTIAQSLIAPPEDLLVELMNTLLSNDFIKFNQDGEVNWNYNGKMLKCVLPDVKYLLNLPPSTWTPSLEESFNAATCYFLKFLSEIQGTDPVTRETGDHIDYEPEWQRAFKIHHFVEPVMISLWKWCATNKNVFIVTFRNCLNQLKSHVNISTELIKWVEFANHFSFCYEYDVSSQPVSLHAPLSRFFAGLYLLLEDHNLEFTSREFDEEFKLNPQQLMEPALRAQVLSAQVVAGMWKRNGFSLEQQVFHYRASTHYAGMRNKDIITLQMGASLIEPNQFLIHCMNRFALSRWVLPGEEDVVRFTAMQNEFLGLIINICSARYVPKVGQVTAVDCVKKAIIQSLCLRPMTHSELNNRLPEDEHGETGIETVVGDVAILKSNDNKYHLKEEFYKDYDWHYLHYSPNDMNQAEHQQRERKNLLKEPEAFPPPPLPPFTSVFSPLVNILKCDVLLDALSFVLERCDSPKPHLGMHMLLESTLHLIGLGLNEEVGRLGSENPFKFCEASEKWRIFDRLKEIFVNPTCAPHRDMILWTRAQRQKILGTLDAEAASEEGSNTGAQSVDQESPDRAKLVAERKARLLEQMMCAQQKFKAINADLFSDESGENSRTEYEAEEPSHLKTVALGPNKTLLVQELEKYTCILCKAEVDPDSSGFVLAAFIQRSSVLCETKDVLHQMESQGVTAFFEKPELWIRRNLLLSPHLSTCGHIMHESCWTSQLLEARYRNARLQRVRRLPPVADAENEEWQCPLCYHLCNAALPITKPLHQFYPNGTAEMERRFVLNTVKHLAKKGKEQKAEADKLGGSSSQGPKEPETGLSHFLASKKAFFAAEQAAKAFLLQGSDQPQIPEDPEPNQALTFPVWLRAMEMLADLQQEGIHQDSTFGVGFSKLIQQLFPLGERLAEALPGHILAMRGRSMNRSMTTTTRDSLVKFMKRVYVVARDTPYVVSENSSVELLRSIWHTLAYTIMSAEVAHRDQNVTFFGDNVPIRYSLGLKFLARLCSLGADARFVAFNLIGMKLRSDLDKLVLSIWRSDPTCPCILELDAFGLLILLTYLSPIAFVNCCSCSSASPPDLAIHPPVGSNLDYYNLRLAYVIHVYQIIVSLDLLSFAHPSTDLEDIDMDNCSGQDQTAAQNLKDVVLELWVTPRESSLSPDDPLLRKFSDIRDRGLLNLELLWAEVSRRVIPFLRCCAKFYECMTGIPPPPQMTSVESSFEDLTDYLDLSKSIHDLFECSEILDLAKRWSAHPSMVVAVSPQVAMGSGDLNLQSLHKLNIPRSFSKSFVELPLNYSDLINRTKVCAKCKKKPGDPAVCMICGVCLCSINDKCDTGMLKNKSVNQCASHAYFCGGGNGIFVRIRSCTLFFLCGFDKVCPYAAPYLDKYGETDCGLRRGNALTLSREKYEFLRRLWIEHKIPQEVARAMERLQNGE